MLNPRYSLSAVLILITLAACASDDTTAPVDPTASPTAAQPALAVTSNSWTTAAPMPTDNVGFGAAAINNSQDQPVVYVLGGSTQDDEHMNGPFTYNVATNTWRPKNIIIDGELRPDGVLRARVNGIARLNTILYVPGGFNFIEGFGENGESLEAGLSAYNTSTNSIVPTHGPTKLGVDGVSGAINGKIYVLIGAAVVTTPSQCDFNCPLAAVRRMLRYDPTTDTWVTRKAPPHYHRKGVGGVINGKFYVVGGFDSDGNATGNLDVYNPANDSWTTAARLPQRLTGLKGTVARNKLYVISPTASYAYTPSSNTWAQKAVGPAGSAARVEGGSAVTVTLNGQERIVVVGGKTTSTGALPKTAIYTP